MVKVESGVLSPSPSVFLAAPSTKCWRVPRALLYLIQRVKKSGDVFLPSSLFEFCCRIESVDSTRLLGSLSVGELIMNGGKM